ncbi:hypothetical protein MTO96_018833 [Rhipicephalus appendiculatus]
MQCPNVEILLTHCIQSVRCVRKEEEVSTSDSTPDVTEEKEESDQQQPGDVEPPTRNVLLKARPFVFGVFELLSLLAVGVYVYYSPKRWPWPLQMSCASLECFNVQAELHSSMDLSAEPCDDFYQYVCGHWAEGHSRYQDPSKVYMKVNDKLRERFGELPQPSKPLGTSDKAVLSYVACTEVLRRGIDVPWLIDSLLFLGKDKPGHFLATSGSKNASAEALATLVSLAMDYDLDVLFEVVLTPDLTASLLRWKRHRERYLTAESTARCVHQFTSVMSCNCNLEPGLTAALVAMDAEVTTKMATSAATSAGKGAHLRFREVPSTHAAVWLRAVRDNLRAAIKDGDEDAVNVDVVRALAPFASYRLAQSLFSDANATAVYLYVADACAAASSKLTSFALATFVFQDVLTARRVQLAHEQVDALRNETMASLSWLEPGDQEAARKRLSSLRSLGRLAGTAKLQRRSERETRCDFCSRSTPAAGSTTLRDSSLGSPEEVAPIQGFRPSVRYSPWLDSLLISPGTLFEPVLFAADSDNQSMIDVVGDGHNTTAAASGVVVALALAGLGHLVAHELWHAALGERTAGTSPEPDITLTGARVRRHACLTDVYKGAAGVAGTGTATDAVASRLTKAASENLADVAGLQVAYAVYAASVTDPGAAAAKKETKTGNSSEAGSWISRVTGFTERELFFIASCFKWCASEADDVVSGSLGFTPARLRCNVPAALTSGFAETFGCSKEHRMTRIANNYSCASPGKPLVPSVPVSIRRKLSGADTVKAKNGP